MSTITRTCRHFSRSGMAAAALVLATGAIVAAGAASAGCVAIEKPAPTSQLQTQELTQKVQKVQKVSPADLPSTPASAGK
jgi:hypothetical protein